MWEFDSLFRCLPTLLISEIAGQSEDELLAARLARLREPVGYSSGASNCAVYTEEQIRARLNRLKYGDQVLASIASAPISKRERYLTPNWS